MTDTRLAGPVIEKVAGETLSGHRAVAVINDAAVYADNETPAHLGRVRGITTGAVVADGLAKVQTYGPMIEPSWTWNPGPIYVSANGVLTQTPPTTGWLQQLAVADTPTRIFIDPQPPIAL